MCAYRRQKRWIQALFFLLFLPLFPESLRTQNKTYFDSMSWEELNDLAISSLPQAYTIEGNHPIPYADTINEDSILPSLPQLGILDYQNIPEDLLSFCDSISAGLTARSIQESSFATQKPFLPHFGRFIIERLPAISHTFYGRPTFKQDGSAQVSFRLTVQPQEKQTAVSQRVHSAETPEPTLELPEPDAKDTEAPNEAAAEPSLVVHNNSSGTVDVPETSEQQEAGLSALFSEQDVPLAIMLELTAMKEDGSWKISGIEVKGAEYADSALEN